MRKASCTLEKDEKRSEKPQWVWILFDGVFLSLYACILDDFQGKWLKDINDKIEGVLQIHS